MNAWLISLFYAGLAALCLAAPSLAQGPPGEDTLDPILAAENATGAILVRRLSDGAEWTAGGERVERRMIPASTFKIPNALIILETGVVADPDLDALAWDGVERSSGWDQDQTLRTAFRRSAVWAFQHWAREVGHERMGEAVSRLEYGNGEIGGADNIATFWLQGPLEISAREQVDFLARLHARTLPVDGTVQDNVIDIMRHRTGEDWTLYAKTGWAIRDAPNHGWYVGWLEAHEGGEPETWLFAVNVDLDYEAGEGALRERLARAALVAAGAPDSLIEP
ncbi:penicillin-binding transpeptidase domain-containing protein [Maricaulaceae bacterium MS644]